MLMAGADVSSSWLMRLGREGEFVTVAGIGQSYVRGSADEAVYSSRVGSIIILLSHMVCVCVGPR